MTFLMLTSMSLANYPVSSTLAAKDEVHDCNEVVEPARQNSVLAQSAATRF